MPKSLLHAHSVWSHDGVLSLEELVNFGKKLGCSRILLSEHEETGWDRQRYEEYKSACEATSVDGVELVPGIEFNQDGFHLLCYGLISYPPRPSTAQSLAEVVRSQGALLCIAHPAKYKWAHPSSLLDAVDAVEVWNSKWIYDGGFGPHHNSIELSKRKILLVGQDIHKRKHISSLIVETPSVNVLQHLRSGEYTVVFNDKKILPANLGAGRWIGQFQSFRFWALRVFLTVLRTIRKI